MTGRATRPAMVATIDIPWVGAQVVSSRGWDACPGCSPVADEGSWVMLRALPIRGAR